MTDERRSRRVNSLGEALGSLARSRDWEEKFHRYQVWQIWDETVGPQIAAHARPHRLRKNVLEVTVDQPVWMQQLQLMKPQILEKLNIRLARAPLADIFLRRGRIPPAEQPVPSPAPPVRRPLTEAEETRIADLMRSIPDPELRNCLKRLLGKQTGLEKPE